jgi:hypothetical protein
MLVEGYGITYQSRGTWISDGKGNENLEKMKNLVTRV